MKLVVVFLALTAVACRAAEGTIERHGGPGKADGGPSRGGEYGDDPGEADAKQDFAPMPPDDPEGGVGDEDATGDDGGAAPPAIAEVPARIAHLACQRRLDCCQPAERSGLPDAPAACEQELADQLTPFFESFARSVAAGRARYDAAGLNGCLAAFESSTCADARTWEPLLLASRCGVAEAALAAGEDCRSSYECMEGFCQGVDQGRDGRCVSPR